MVVRLFRRIAEVVPGKYWMMESMGRWFPWAMRINWQPPFCVAWIILRMPHVSGGARGILRRAPALIAT